MNILELSAAMARTFVTQEQADDAMLLACCKAAEAELLSFLKSGLTEEDWIAFPYDRELREGMTTEEAQVDALYGN